MLPLFIGDFIRTAEPHWENYLLMLTIVDYAFGPITFHEVVPYLKTVIQEHHDNFCHLYPNAPVTPKFHYIIHLPEWLLR